MLDVITIGSGTLDIFIKSDQFKDGKISEGKAEAQELVMVSGGGATNSAVGFARKGITVAPIIEMGTDPAAEMILSELKKEGVNVQLAIQEEKETTAVSIILLSGGPTSLKLRGMNKSSILTYRGASRMLTESDIPFGKLGFLLKPEGWIYLTSIGNMELVEKIIGWAREKRRKIFFNPGVAEIQALKGQSLSTQGLSLINAVNVMQLNKREAEELFGKEIPALEKTILIVTDGERGGEVLYQGQRYQYEGIKTEMVDATGAGDAFGSGFMAGLILGKSVQEAIEWGRKQGASVVKYTGAKKGLLTLEQLI